MNLFIYSCSFIAQQYRTTSNEKLLSLDKQMDRWLQKKSNNYNGSENLTNFAALEAAKV